MNLFILILMQVMQIPTKFSNIAPILILLRIHQFIEISKNGLKFNNCAFCTIFFYLCNCVSSDRVQQYIQMLQLWEILGRKLTISNDGIFHAFGSIKSIIFIVDSNKNHFLSIHITQHISWAIILKKFSIAWYIQILRKCLWSLIYNVLSRFCINL